MAAAHDNRGAPDDPAVLLRFPGSSDMPDIVELHRPPVPADQRVADARVTPDGIGTLAVLV